MPKLMLNTTFEFLYLKSNMNIYKLQLSLLSPWGLGMMNSMGKVIVVASMYPASKTVVKPIKCEYTSIFHHILFSIIEKLRYVSYN